jgi:parvulin-like peptidyl-prolyl isomerase
MLRALVVVLGVALSGVALRADILEQILVKVNGDIITKTDLETRQVAALRQRPDYQQLRDQGALQKALAEVTPRVIVDAVDELILQQRGKELGYTMNDEQFKNIVENIRKENKLEDEKQFEAALKSEGMTMQDLRKSLERQMIVTRVQQAEVLGKISVSDEEAKAYYEKNKATFTTTPTLTLREILVAVPTSPQGINAAADDAAKAKAEDIRKRLLAGEPFARLAADLSDSPSKANGGLIGDIKRDEVAPALQQELDPMKPGEVSNVLRTPRGYQILKLDNVTGAAVKPYDEARTDIGNRIYDEKRRAEFAKYLKKLRGQAIIEWKNDEMKKAYEVGVAQSEAPQTAQSAVPGPRQETATP